MDIELVLPPTTNATYLVGNGRMYKSEKANDWRKYAFFTIKQNANHPRYTGDVFVNIKFFIKRSRDVDGAVKPSLDVLQDAMIVNNDSQVKKLVVTKFSIKGTNEKEKMVISVRPIQSA